MKLAAEGLSKRYDVDVLCGCSLSIGEGECVLVRGRSGGGKSTLLRILARLETADSGRVIHGPQHWDAAQPSNDPPFPFLTLVFQQLFLWPHLTMAENLAIVLSHDRRAGLGPEMLAMCGRLGLAALLSRKPHECSIGQRQRLAIARGLLSQARFLLLDEPSSALDQASRQAVVAELVRAKSDGRGLLIVTHDERDFAAIADQRLMLDAGKLNAF